MGHDKKSGGSALARLRSRLKQTGDLGHVSKGKKKRLDPARKAVATAAAAAAPIEVVNPFEIKVNRQKHQVLGKQRQGDLGGAPAQSKSRAVEQRTKTLLVEHRKKGHTSMIIDQRFGERDDSMTEEEKMLARFAKEREIRKRKSAYNLEDEDEDDGIELTHLGRSLSSFDKFDDMPRMSDDDDDDDANGDRGELDAALVRRAHFGGFDDEEAHDGEDGDARPKTKREVMREIIAKSKMHKMERQAQKEEDMLLVEKLDADLGAIRDLLGPRLNQPRANAERDDDDDDEDDDDDDDKEAGKKRRRQRKQDEEPEDDYDALLREMAKERRARPTDRMKTAEELAREEFLKLERLERDRQRRMLGVDSAAASSSSSAVGGADESGDSLGSNVALSRRDERRRRQAIAYKDGKLVLPSEEETAIEEETRLRRRAMKRGLGDDDDDAREAVDDDDESGESDEEEDESDGEEGEEEDDEEEEGEEEDEEEEEEEEVATASGKRGRRPSSAQAEDEDDEDDDEDEDENEDEEEDEDALDMGIASDDSDLEDESAASSRRRAPPASAPAPAHKKAIMEAAKAEVPFLFAAMPETHEAFMALVGGRPAADVAIVITRLRTQFHVSLAADNRRRQQALFGVLLQYIEHVGDVGGHGAHMAAVLPPLRELAEVSQEDGVQTVLARLRAMKRAATADESGAVRMLSAGHIAVARALLYVYPPSDMRHAVLTPLLLLLGHVLSFAELSDASAHARALACACLMLDAQAQARRYSPEAIVALRRLLRAIFEAGEPAAGAVVALPADVAVADAAAVDGALGPLLLLAEGAPIDASQRAALARCVIEAVLAAARLFAPQLLAFDAVFAPMAALLERRAPADAAALRVLVDESIARRTPLQWQRHKPIAIKEYNPKFDVHYAPGRKQRDINPDRAEVQKLKAQVRKERKGALRALRHDNAFMADVRRAEKKAKDDEYNARIKSITTMISQEHQSLSKEERIYAAKKRKK